MEEIKKEEIKVEEHEGLLAGYAETKVTPPMGINIPGYFNVRLSDGVITDLYIHAAAFSVGGKKAVFFTCDAVGMRVEAARIIRPMVAERCGIDPESVYISCSHSHTSFRITEPSGKNTPNDIFLLRLYQQFCDTAQFAFEDLKPARLKFARGEADGISFLRRYRMKDGTVKTNPPYGSEEILRPEGLADRSLILLRVLREDAPELLFVCFGTHADVIGGTKYCADYPGYLTEMLTGAFGGRAKVLFFNGCEGDSNHFNPFQPKGTPRKGTALAQRMARVIAGEVLKIYDGAKDVPCDSIDYSTVTVKVGKNPYDPADLPVAYEMKAIYDRVHDIKSPELEPYKGRLNLPEALRIIRNLDRPEFFELGLSFLRLGEAVFVGIPGEPFQEIGLVIKEQSPYPLTVVTACTNGHEGYYPTAAAFSEKGYERSTSPFAWDCAELLEKGALDGLTGLKEKENA